VDAAQGEKAWAVDDLVDALVKMRGKAKKKLAVRRIAQTRGQELVRST